jgi:hypothetical protein
VHVAFCVTDFAAPSATDMLMCGLIELVAASCY